MTARTGSGVTRAGLTADTITDEMLEVMRDVACECRPRPEIEVEHCAQHDCDAHVYDQCVVALEAVDEEAYTARYNCALMANAMIGNDGPHSAYWRALSPLYAALKAKPGGA